MLKIAIIIFRESAEVALLLGILIAVTRRITSSRRYIVIGVLLGIVLASIFAFFIRQVSITYSGIGDEIVDSIIILLTVAMISYTVVWMQDFGYKVRKNVEELSVQVNKSISNRVVLILIVTSTVLREGVEMILFVSAIISADRLSVDDYLIGLATGVMSGILFSMVVYLGLIKCTERNVFKISSVLLALIAAGLASNAAALLSSSGIIEVFSDTLWDSSWLIQNRSSVGQILKALIGYDSKPNGLQLIFYFGTLGFIVLLLALKRIYMRITKNRTLDQERT